jgi:hypothetical protein
MNHGSGAEAHRNLSGDTAWESHPVPAQPVARQSAVQPVPLQMLQQAALQQAAIQQAAMQQAALHQQQVAIQHISMQQHAIQQMQQAAMMQAAMQQGVLQPGPMPHYQPSQHYQQAASSSSASQNAAPPPLQQAQQQAQMQAHTQQQQQQQQQAQQSQALQQMQQQQQMQAQQQMQQQQQMQAQQQMQQHPQQQLLPQRRRQDAASGDGDISAEALHSILLKLPEEGDEERVEAMQNARPRSLSGENKVLEMGLLSPRHGGGVGGRGALSSVQSASAGRARFRSVGSFSGFSIGMVDGQAPTYLSTVAPLQAAHESNKVSSAPISVKREQQQQLLQEQRDEGADSTEDDEPVTRVGALSESAPVSRTTSSSGLSKRSSAKAGSARLIGGSEGEAVGEAAAPTAKAIKVPADGEFVIGLEGPMMDLLWPGGPELNALQHQKLLDATELLQSMNMHPLEPLRLYTKMQLYELMTSMAEAWKNSGKAAWKKRINKIKGNARARKNGNGQLDKKELLEIAELEARIRQRVIWEKQQKALLGGTDDNDDNGSDSEQGGAKISRKRAQGDSIKQELLKAMREGA